MEWGSGDDKSRPPEVDGGTKHALGLDIAVQQTLGVDLHYLRNANANQSETMTGQTQIILKGWTHVHTWEEGHGEYTDYVYQKDCDPQAWFRRVELLTVTVYRDGRATGIRTDNSKFAHDYLLAWEIWANVDGVWVAAGERGISPCCTSGHEDFVNTRSNTRYRVAGAVGHGEWAFKIEEDD